MRRTLLSFALLVSAPYMTTQASVYEIPISSLPKYEATTDVLGVDADKGVALIRIDPKQLAVKRDANMKPVPDSQFINASLDKYMDPSKLNIALNALTDAYPNLITRKEFGITTDGNKLQVLEITAPNSVKAKPVILFNGMHHAREVITTEVVYDIADYLTKNYGKDPEVTNWLDNYIVVVVPQVNPDGNDYVHKTNPWWRKNTWKMFGFVTGVDLNRNYPYMWNGCNGSSDSPFSEAYRGTAAASEPETQAMMDIVERYEPVFDISYHSFSELIIYPFGCTKKQNDAKALFHEIGQAMNQAIVNDRGQTGNYRVGTAPELLYQADGSDLDYQWAEHNVMGYTIEVNSSSQGFQPDYDDWRDKTVANQRGGWQALLKRMGEQVLEMRVADPSNMTYKIYKKESKANFALYDYGINVKTRKVRKNGLIYQILPKGEYKIELFKNGKLTSTLPFNIGETITRLK